MANFKDVNKSLKANFAGLDISAVRGEGYIYFVGAHADNIESVYVNPVTTPTNEAIDLCMEVIQEELHERERVGAVDEDAVLADANFAEEVHTDIKSGKQQVIDSIVELQNAAPGTYTVTGAAAAHMAKLVTEQLVREHNTFKPPVRPYAKSYHNRVVTAMTAESNRLKPGTYHKSHKVKLVEKLARYAERAA